MHRILSSKRQPILLLCSVFVLILNLFYLVRVCFADDAVPATFIFGDSLVDAGNNNYIVTYSRADYYPNGIDFGRATGRFNNGRTVVDIIGQQLGLQEFTPPYLAPTTTGQAILNGVNYASGAGGILNSSGELFIGRINMDAQLDNFANTRQDIISSIGFPAASKLFAKAIFSVTMGSNDFLNNYLVPIASIARHKSVPPEKFVYALISRFRTQLTRLHSLGARKIIVTNVGPLGCIPYQRDLNPMAGDSCVAFPNHLASLFNAQLKPLVMELNCKLNGSRVVYADVYHIVSEIIQNFESYGFENFDSACCRSAGRFGGLVPCVPSSTFCPDRYAYMFWDAYHPSEAANIIIARQLMDGDSTYIFPVNVRQLVQA